MPRCWAGYGFAAAKVRFLPLGNDSGAWSYHVETVDGGSLLPEGAPRRPRCGEIAHPRYLREQGQTEVVAALPAISGALWQPVDGFGLILYPFVAGRNGMDVGLTEAQWGKLGTSLRRIHAMTLPPDLAAQSPRETFNPPWGDTVRQIGARVERGEFADPAQREPAEFWRGRGAEIREITARAEQLGRRMQDRTVEYVLCHADIHTANVLVDDDGGLHIVDWDGAVCAPRERDLMHVVNDLAAPTQQESAFFEGYGEVEIDPLALAYYRYEWVVQELGDYGARVFLADDVGADTVADAVRGLIELFDPGDVVDGAYAAEGWL